MLSSVSSPQLPLSWITVTSPEGKSTCFHYSVSILSLIKIREWVFWGSALCVVGYTGTQSLEATEVPKFDVAGSCRATMLIPFLASAMLEIRLCWQVGDLLTFSCQIVMVLGFLLRGLALLHLCVVPAISPILGAWGPLQGNHIWGRGSFLLWMPWRQHCSVQVGHSSPSFASFLLWCTYP